MKSRIWLTMIITGVALAAVLFAACGASEEYEDSASIVHWPPRRLLRQLLSSLLLPFLRLRPLRQRPLRMPWPPP